MDTVAVFLFGSAARGDPDEASDIDVIAIYSSEVKDSSRIKLQPALKQQFGDRVALAEYSQTRIDEMFGQGHLFAWHLFLEAQSLRIEGLNIEPSYSFPLPAPYAAGKKDALRFLELLRSTHAELIKDGVCSEVHEAGLTYLSLRNIGMSLSYSCCVQPDFSRYSPYSLSNALGIAPPCNQSTYNALIKARHSSQRGLPAPIIGVENLIATVTQCLNWTELVLEKVDGKQ
jgi:hypothetical protein